MTMLIKEYYMAESEEHAKDIRTRMLNRWPREGYGTYVSLAPDATFPAPYTWRVSVERQHSCD